MFPPAKPPWGTSVARGFVVEARILAVLSLLLPGVLLSGSVHGQTIALEDTVYRLSEVVVEAERLSRLEALQNRPAFVTIVPMDDAARRVTSAAEYLARTVGFHVRSTGGYGAYSTASIRGSSSKQVTVFIDGVPLGRSHAGLIDLADLPLASVARVEVYRGFGAFDLSGSNIGGVVNIVTRGPERPGGGGARLRLSASYGSLSTQRYGASSALSPGDWDVLLIGSALSTDGDFDFLDDNGTPHNKADDETVGRINNHLEERELLVKLGRPLENGTLILANQFYHRKQGLPGYSSFQSPSEALTKSYDLLHGSWTRPGVGGLPLEIQVGLFGLYQVDRYEDRRPPGEPPARNETNRSLAVGGSLRWKAPLVAARQALRGMVEVRRESFRPEETYLDTVQGEEQVRRSWVVTLEDEIDLWPGRLRLVPSGRYERYTDRTRPFETVRSDLASYFRGLADTSVTHVQRIWTLGLVGSPGAGLALKANYGRYYRVPSLMEIFGYRGLALPNPALRPETGLNRDVGLRWERHFGPRRFVSLEYAYFWSEVEDLIMYTYSPWARAAQAVNMDNAQIEGYEVSLSCGRWRGLTLAGNLTHLTAVNTGPVRYLNGKYLPHRPQWEGFGRVQWEGWGATVFYEYDHISGNYWNAYNGVAPNGEGPLFRVRRLHALGCTVPTGVRGLEFTAEAKNLTDERVEDVMGYPLPGRSVYGTLVYTF